MMLCGNTAALREYEALQDRLERQAPTEDELDRYVEDWIDRKRYEMGVEFILEALNETDDAGRIKLFRSWGDTTLEFGSAVREIVNLYWRPMAEKDAETHNFEEDRHE